MDAANSSQFQVTSLKQQLEREQAKRERLENQVELLLQRIEGLEGTDLRPQRGRVVRDVEEPAIADDKLSDELDSVDDAAPKRRGRPRKV